MWPGTAPAPHGAAQPCPRPESEKDTHQVEVLLSVQILHCEEQEGYNSLVRTLHPHENTFATPKSTNAQPGFLLPAISAPFSAGDHIVLHHTAGPGEHGCQLSVDPGATLDTCRFKGMGLTSAQRAVLLV